MAQALRRLSARPLFATTPDQRLYVEREADHAVRDAVVNGLNVAILGERGAGTTSLLHALQFHLSQHADEPQPVFVNAAGLDAAEVLDAVGQAVPSADLTSSVPPPPGRSDGEEHGEARLVILLDGASLAAFRELFGVGRDARWQEGHQWVLAIPAEDATSYLAPPADSFIEVQVPLGGMNQTELTELLSRRLEAGVYVPEVLDGMTPREIITAARTGGVEHLAETARAATDLNARATALGRPAAMLFAELQALGTASASDPRLLDRLGWTAARAGQVFRILLDEGLVEYSDEREGRPGRPRRLYRVREES